MRVIFLLGSGICVDAGMLNVGEISEQVFSGAGVVRHSDATHYIAGEGSPNYDYTVPPLGRPSPSPASSGSSPIATSPS